MPDARREEARRLRRDPGLSRAQLMKHFGVGNGTLTDWLRGVEPPTWTRRPNAKDELREQAVHLRSQGWSLNDISKRLGVAKSTAHNWVGHIPLDPDSERAKEKRELALRRVAGRWDTHRRERDQQQADTWQAAARDVGELSERDLVLLGAVAYWCEGSKSKPWLRNDRLTFINSDPGLLELFLRFLAVSGVSADEVNYRVHIHETADAVSAQDWWATRLAVPRHRFRRPTIKRHVPSTRRGNVGEDYHGCLVVDVPKSRLLYWRMEGVARAVFEAASSGSSRESMRR